MIPVVDIEMRSFSDLDPLRDHLEGQDRRDFEVQGDDIVLTKDGVFQAKPFEGPLTRSALSGLLGSLQIPEDFALEVCRPELLTHMIKRLWKSTKPRVRIHTVDGIVTAVFPADRMPLRHAMLLRWLDIEGPIQDATLGPDYLRITALNKDTRELLPGDEFGFGWELRTSENGWLGTEARQYVMRLVCTNGMVGFDRTRSFRRPPTSRAPIYQSLEKLAGMLGQEMEPAGLDRAAKWAADHCVGDDVEPVIAYLTRMLEGEITAVALATVTGETSWYDLMNTVTALGRTRSLRRRRDHEVAGGMLLSWFLREGRGRAPWRKGTCQSCDKGDEADL